MRPGFELLLDSAEVREHLRGAAELSSSIRSNHRTRRRRIGTSEYEIDVIDIPFGEHNIWGATAGMIFTLYRMCMEERRMAESQAAIAQLLR